MPEDIDRVFKALADPGRRHLLDVLHAQNGQTLGALCEHLDMSRQAVTQHLAMAGKAALPESGTSARDLGALDREVRAFASARAARSQEASGRRRT
jgi:DNA-binding transcriptional ArsR family regulator